jgi:hypothetical protein
MGKGGAQVRVILSPICASQAKARRDNVLTSSICHGRCSIADGHDNLHRRFERSDGVHIATPTAGNTDNCSVEVGDNSNRLGISSIDPKDERHRCRHAVAPTEPLDARSRSGK